MNKFSISLRLILLTHILIPAIAVGVLLAIYLPNKAADMFHDEVEHALSFTCDLTLSHYEDIDGDWQISENKLFKGTTNITDDPYITSGSEANVDITFFFGDVRYATSIVDASGNAIIGTKCSDEVKKVVLEENKEYFTNDVVINNKDYYGYYKPVTLDDKVIGMVFAGKERTGVENNVTSIRRSTLTVTSLVLLLVIFVGVILSNIILSTLKRLIESVDTISDGDLSEPVYMGCIIAEFKTMADATEVMRNNMLSNIQIIKNNSESIMENSQHQNETLNESQRVITDITNAVNDLAVGATTMAEDIQEAVMAVSDMSEVVESVANSANSNLDNVESVKISCNNLATKIKELKEADSATDEMATNVAESIRETSIAIDSISKAAEAIINIAKQTNLLSLNASIEAARVGEAGKGFAVVAGEIKNLSEESSQSASEITELLSNLSRLSENNNELAVKIKDATNTMTVALESMSGDFESMQLKLDTVVEGNTSILKLVDTVNSDKDKIMVSMDSLSSISEENAASTQETSASLEEIENGFSDIVSNANNMVNAAKELNESTDVFKIS